MNEMTERCKHPATVDGRCCDCSEYVGDIKESDYNPTPTRWRALLRVARAAKALEELIDGMGIRSSFRDVGSDFESLTDALKELPEELMR